MASDGNAPSRFRVPLATAETHVAIGPFLRRLALLIGLITALVVLGTAGFALTEDVSVWFGFQLTLNTIATVGSIPHPDTVGGQITEIVLITLGVGTLFYALVTATEFFVAGHLTGLLDERRTLKMIDSLSGHHLICGFGRVGRQVARDLRTAGQKFVVIDHNPDHREVAEAMDAPFLAGQPSADELLREAGIERAASVIACVDSDAENIFVTLTARELSPEITIVARASVEDSESKLRRAGADRVISPYKTSGTEMTRLALHPQVPVAVDVSPEYRIEQIEVAEDCDGAGRPISEVRGGATVVAVNRVEGEIDLEPDAEVTLGPGDVVVAVGSDAALDELEAKFARRGRPTEESHPEL